MYVCIYMYIYIYIYTHNVYVCVYIYIYMLLCLVSILSFPEDPVGQRNAARGKTLFDDFHCAKGLSHLAKHRLAKCCQIECHYVCHHCHHSVHYQRTMGPGFWTVWTSRPTLGNASPRKSARVSEARNRTAHGTPTKRALLGKPTLQLCAVFVRSLGSLCRRGVKPFLRLPFNEAETSRTYLPYSTPLRNRFGAVFGCGCRLRREICISQNWQ